MADIVPKWLPHRPLGLVWLAILEDGHNEHFDSLMVVTMMVFAHCVNQLVFY